jgi:hypothetical protein
METQSSWRAPTGKPSPSRRSLGPSPFDLRSAILHIWEDDGLDFGVIVLGPYYVRSSRRTDRFPSGRRTGTASTRSNLTAT